MVKVRTERFIVIGVAILFALTVLIYSIFFAVNFGFIISLLMSTLLCTMKLLINSYYFNKILNRKTSNIVFSMLYNALFILIFILCVYILKLYLGNIDLMAAIGLLIGAGYIPLVITVGGILQSLYFFRNKLY